MKHYEDQRGAVIVAASLSPLGKYANDWLRPDAHIRYAESRERRLYAHYDTEQALIGRWLRLCPSGSTVLDLPCGVGRFSELTAACGHRLIRGDLSYQMVAHARDLGPNQHVLGNLCCDLAHPPLAERSVDVVLVWRLFHHLRRPAHREILLEQARRLARRYVIVSYYNRASLTYWGNRLVRGLLRRKPKGGGAIWTADLLDIAGKAGLKLHELHHYSRGISINSAACFSIPA